MRRVFTHLASGRQRVLQGPWRSRPGLSHFVEAKQHGKTKQQKCPMLRHRAPLSPPASMLVTSHSGASCQASGNSVNGALENRAQAFGRARATQPLLQYRDAASARRIASNPRQRPCVQGGVSLPRSASCGCDSGRIRVPVQGLGSNACSLRGNAAIWDACHVESQHPAGVPVVTDKSHHATPLHFKLHCTAASAGGGWSRRATKSL